MSNEPTPVASLADLIELEDQSRPIGLAIEDDTPRTIKTPLNIITMEMPLDFYGVESGGIRTFAPAGIKDDPDAFGGDKRLANAVYDKLMSGEECFCGQRCK